MRRLCPAPRPRAIRACISSVGPALGNIIAAIMTVHMTKTSSASRSDHGAPPPLATAVMPVIVPLLIPPYGIGMRTSTNQETAVTDNMPAHTVRRSREGSCGGAPVWYREVACEPSGVITAPGSARPEFSRAAAPEKLTAQPS